MSIRVILADDHTILRDGLSALLDSQKDISVIGQASDGREAVRAVEENKVDVAILDIGMPKLNGIEAAQLIASAVPNCKVIILTMFSTSEHIYRALRAGVRGYLLKDAAGGELVDAVRTVHSGRRYLSEQVSDKVIGDYLDAVEDGIDRSPITRLTQREREVLQLVVEGKPSAKIAEMLAVSSKTIDTYRSRIMKKLEIDDLPSLIRFSIQHGITPLE